MTLPFQPDSETSADAADEARRDAPTQRQRVLTAITAAGWCGATDEELQDRLQLNPSTQRPRRVELVASGLVVDSGRTRRTRSGRRAVVWVDVLAMDGQQMRLL